MSPSASARALVTGSSRTLGLVVSDIVNPFFAELMREFEHYAECEGYQVVVITIDGDSSRIEQSIQRVLERKVDGVAVMMVGQAPLTKELRRRQIPAVFLQGEQHAPTVSTINVDTIHGIQQAIGHLRGLKHRKVAYIGPGLDLIASRLRLEAIEATAGSLFDRGAAFLGFNPTLQGGLEGMSHFLGQRRKISSVIMFNDTMSFGAYRACTLLGLRIPHDLSIVGFDDVEMSQYLSPPLTTIRFSRCELARLAVASLLGMVRATSTGQVFTLTTELVVRSSTAMQSK